MRNYAIALGCLLGPAPALARQADPVLERMMAGGPILDGPELARAVAEAERAPLGSKQNPVRASGPGGQRAYLDRLRCADGSAPDYTRGGNEGPGPYLSIVDLYLLDCGRAAPGRAQVRMDMYFKNHVENRPVPGFTMAGR